MTPRVEVLFTRAWVGRKPGDRARVQPNVARLWVRMRVAEIVPTVITPPAAAVSEYKQSTPHKPGRTTLSLRQ